MARYDYIIVGAGSSGCVLARRLSDDPRNRVLLIEGGGANDSLFIRMAAGFARIMGDPTYFRFFPVARQAGRGEERHSYGRGLGGSSAVNGMWYLRGQPRDFEAWRARGLPSWGWDDIARCYAAIEDYRAPGANARRGTDGELQITPSTYRSPVIDALLAGAEQIGLPRRDDINAPGVSGIGRTQYTVDRAGRRASSYAAFVAPVAGRANLDVVTDAAVERVLIRDGRTRGIVARRRGESVRYEADGEVILSAGVYGSPHLLMLSGIGPGDQLAAHGIAVARDLPAVGENWCDHQKVGLSFDLSGHPGLNREFDGWRLARNVLRYLATGTGPLARVGLPLTALAASEGEPADWPDLQLAASPFAMRTVKEMAAAPGKPITPQPGITFAGFHLRPRGRGQVRLASADPATPPIVDPRFWQAPSDQAKALELLRRLRAWAGAPALARYVGRERQPGADLQDDAALLEALRGLTEPGLHGTGTCSMGTDPREAVVDDRCRVHGIEGLRVVDCSVIPAPISGNTNAPAMAIAQRAAELIRADAR